VTQTEHFVYNVG